LAEALAYLNGRRVPASQACLPVYDSGVVLGAAVTEQTRTFCKQLYRLEEHLERFLDSVRCLRIDLPIGKDELAGVSRELVAHNAALLPDGGELGLIQFATPGPYAGYAGMSLAAAAAGPTICVHTFPLPFARWAAAMRHGAHLITPPTRHVPPRCYDPKIKARSRLHFYLAEQEARLVDPKAWALLLDLDGNVAEGAGANFLIVKGGVIESPPPTNILPGVSKATVMELAARLGIAFQERTLQVYDVEAADEAFLTSTPYCLVPVTRVNGRAIGDGRPGRIYHRLLEAWSKAVDVDIQRQILDAERR
jgi:branched-chain amino acid aminotransferase